MNITSLTVQAEYTIAFLVAAHCLALLTWPMCRSLFSCLPDEGYAFSRLVAIVALGLLSWVLYSLDIISNSVGGIFLCVFILVLFNRWVARKSGSRFFDFSALRCSYIVLIESLFYISVAAWLFVRWCDPDVSHTEQPMDLMMLNALWNSISYPPEDLWLAGYPVSYYYFGYWLQHICARLIYCPPVLSYNIAQAVWFALLIVGCFSLGCNLAAAAAKKYVMILIGMVCTAGIMLISNLSGFISACAKSEYHWWWWAASRSVHDGHTELITEFPFFSFLLGDNHPHLLALPLLLLFSACCLNLLFRGAQERDHATHPLQAAPIHIYTLLASMGLISGTLYVSNTWNYPMTFFLAGLTCFALPYTMKKRMVLIVLYCLITPIILLFVFLPYHLTAQSQLSGLTFLHPFHTDLSELLLMFGYFLPGIILLLFTTCKSLFSMRDIGVSMKYGLICFSAGLVCVLIPEMVYFNDVFSNRMNTVFKFYYQAWFFLAIASACGLYETWKFHRLRYLLIPVALFLSTGFFYPMKALCDKTNGFTPSRLGIHVLGWFEQNHSDEANALHWLQAHALPHETILVSEGVDYEPLTVMSSLYAGFPMLIGWFGHEQQWRGDAFFKMAGTRPMVLESVFNNASAGAPLSCDMSLLDSIRFILINRNGPNQTDSNPRALCPNHTFEIVFSNRTSMIYEKK